MLTTNINLEDRLVNCLIGRVMGFKSTDSTFKVMYVRFNDEKEGKMAMQRDNVACQSCWLPVEKVETSFSLRKNKYIQISKEFNFCSFFFGCVLFIRCKL